MLLRRQFLGVCAGVALSFGLSGLALAEDTVKIGLILPMTGPSASTGREIEAAIKLYMQQNGDKVAGKKIESLPATIPVRPTSPSAWRRSLSSTKRWR